MRADAMRFNLKFSVILTMGILTLASVWGRIAHPPRQSPPPSTALSQIRQIAR